MTTIDVYARVSRASDKRNLSTNGQIAECRENIEERSYEVGEIHVDSSKSAWNTRVRRVGWEAVMARLEAGVTDGVMVFELSRFARRQEDGLRLLRLAQAGAIVIDSENEYDLSKPRQAKNFRDAISAAEYESDMISLRTRRGKRQKAASGQPNHSTRPFGFEADGITPREDEAALMRELAERILAGEEQWPLCRELNERGILTVLGNPWKPPSLRTGLLRPGNVGDIVHRGEVVQRAVHPGILDRDVYDRIVAFYAARRRGRPATNLLTGYLVCERCRRNLHAKELVHHKPYPSGEVARTYRCVTRAGEGCGNYIDWKAMNDFGREVVLTVLSDPAHADAVEASGQAHDDEMNQVSAKIIELESLATELAERMGRGELPLARYDVAVRPLDEQLARLRSRQERLRAEAPSRLHDRKRASRTEWERRWAETDIVGRRSIVAEALRGQKMLLSAGGRWNHPGARVRLSV